MSGLQVSAGIERGGGVRRSKYCRGQLRGTKRQFAYFLQIAAGSNGEVRSWLYLAADRHYVAPERAAALIEATNETGRMIQGLMNSLFRGRHETAPDESPPPE